MPMETYLSFTLLFENGVIVSHDDFNHDVVLNSDWTWEILWEFNIPQSNLDEDILREL